MVSKSKKNCFLSFILGIDKNLYIEFVRQGFFLLIEECSDPLLTSHNKVKCLCRCTSKLLILKQCV